MKKRVLIPPASRQPRLTGGKNGAPFGNRNAVKHGRFTHKRRTLYKEIREHIRRGRRLIKEIGATPSLPS